MRVQRGVISYSPRALSVYVRVPTPPKVVVYIRWITELFRYTCGVGSKAVENGKSPALPERCTTRAKPHLRSFNLKVGNREHQDAQVWSQAHPLRPKRTIFSLPGRVLETSSARFGVGGARSAARRHGGVLLHARRRVKRGTRGEVFFGASRRSQLGCKIFSRPPSVGDGPTNKYQAVYLFFCSTSSSR